MCDEKKDIGGQESESSLYAHHRLCDLGPCETVVQGNVILQNINIYFYASSVYVYIYIITKGLKGIESARSRQRLVEFARGTGQV